MKNKIVAISVLLASQLIMAAAAFACADSDKRIDALLQAPLQQIAQGMDGSNSYPSPAASGGATEEPAGAKVRSKRSKHSGGKRKHGTRGRFKRRLSSNSSDSGAEQGAGNACCTATSSSGM